MTLLTLFLASATFAGPRCAVYGFDPKARMFRGKPPSEVAETTAAWGVAAVFGGTEDADVRKALQKRGIRVYAELPVFVGTRHWKEHPESKPIDRLGRPIEADHGYAGVCPSQSWLLAKLEARAKDLVTRLGADGVWLDFIRYPGRWEDAHPRFAETCFCPACVAKFSADTGARPPASAKTAAEAAEWILANHRDDWHAWKASNIAEAAARLAKAVKAAKPKAVVGAFVVGFDAEDHDGARARVFGQDPEKLSKAVDVLSPMAYHTPLERPVGWVRESVLAWARPGRRVWPIVWAGEERKPTPFDEFAQALSYAKAAPSEGVIAFSFPALVAGENLKTIAAACKR